MCVGEIEMSFPLGKTSEHVKKERKSLKGEKVLLPDFGIKTF